MKIQVLEGALVEAPAADATGMDRRAFGEFVSHRGELASYAFGWTTGPEPAARFTVGMGVGNEGGGTFHAAVFAHDGDLQFALVDEPFERVPEGGPHLTAAQARAHDTLPFIWWVVDRVVEHDRRGRWMRHWLLGTTSIQTGEVFAGHEPVLRVTHEASDGMWQLIGASDADPRTGRIGHLHHAVDADRTLLDILDLEPGHTAKRRGPGKPWKRSPRR